MNITKKEMKTKNYDYINVFQNMITAIQEHLPLYAVILFGSRARRTAVVDSDYDVIIIGGFTQKFIDRGVFIARFLPHLPLDIFCYTPEEFSDLFTSFNLTAIDGIGEGIVLFGQDFIHPYKVQYKKLIKQGMKKYKNVLFPPSFTFSISKK